MQMCGFTSLELEEIYALQKDSLETFWSTGRGRRCTANAKDSFFTTRVTMKYGGT